MMLQGGFRLQAAVLLLLARPAVCWQGLSTAAALTRAGVERPSRARQRSVAPPLPPLALVAAPSAAVAAGTGADSSAAEASAAAAKAASTAARATANASVAAAAAGADSSAAEAGAPAAKAANAAARAVANASAASTVASPAVAADADAPMPAPAPAESSAWEDSGPEVTFVAGVSDSSAECEMSAWTEWSDCGATAASRALSGTSVRRRTREVVERSGSECPCTVEFTICGKPGEFGDLLADIKFRQNLQAAPYTPVPLSTPGPTLRPLTDEEVQASLERIADLEGCIVMEWSEWSPCDHHRWTYKLKAAMQTRTREVARINTTETCPHGEETRTCMDNGPIRTVVFDFH